MTFPYVLAHIPNATFLLSLLILIFDPAPYTTFGVLHLLAMILFAPYVYKRITNYGFGAFLFRAGLFMVLFFVLYIRLSNVIFLLFMLFGELAIQGLTAPK